MTANKNILSVEIKSLRKSLNMSQQRFGKKIGVTGKSISAYERGRCTPPLKVLEKISEVYNAGFVTVSEQNKKLLSQKLNNLKELISELEKRFLAEV